MIGIDVRKYFDFGIGTYIQNLLSVYDKQNNHPRTLFVSPNDESLIRQKHQGTIVANLYSKYSLQELFLFSRQITDHKIDLFHVPHYTLPYFLKCKSVVTIHDLIHIRFPEYFTFAQRMYAKSMVKHACSSADIILVDSEFTRQDLLTDFAISPDRVKTIYLGVSDNYSTDVTDIEKKSFLNKYKLTKPYIVYVGNIKPHKNIPVLLKAFAQSGLHHAVDLVFVGGNIESNAKLMNLVHEYKISTSTKNLGRISEKELIAAYQCASLNVLPSRYEGFGFSILEAMKAGIPVIGANAASIPEVMGNAGILFQPENSDELSEALKNVIEDSQVRKDLITRGFENVKKYSWERCASETMHVYQSLLS
ncbi:MAG: glycosyltransferase family 1 protein [Bacteroidota bacterium]|nr:glycosyltransferase family 1 protein [Bacteroidota bacterium]